MRERADENKQLKVKFLVLFVKLPSCRRFFLFVVVVLKLKASTAEKNGTRLQSAYQSIFFALAVVFPLILCSFIESKRFRHDSPTHRTVAVLFVNLKFSYFARSQTKH